MKQQNRAEPVCNLLPHDTEEEEGDDGDDAEMQMMQSHETDKCNFTRALMKICLRQCS